jgi:hypothetical protein
MGRRLRWIAATGLAALVAMPAAAQGTLTFVRQPLKPTVWVAADDGSAQRRLAAGSNPHVSPDGQAIAYLRTRGGASFRPELMVAPADGSAPARRLLASWAQPDVFDWSSDSTTIAAVRGPELGRKRLVVIDVASGAQRTIARGFFAGASFSPQGSGQLVYARAAKEGFPLRSDIFRIDLLPPGAIPVAPEVPHRLTSDHRSLYPLWGPEEIVFVRLQGLKKRRYGPKFELFVMSPGGRRVSPLTRTEVDPLMLGLVPVEIAAGGGQMLAEFTGQDTSYGVAVNPRTGNQRRLGRSLRRGFIGTAISDDGELALGWTGGFEPGPGRNVVTVPLPNGTGGSPKVLARNAFEPDWSR